MLARIDATLEAARMTVEMAMDAAAEAEEMPISEYLALGDVFDGPTRAERDFEEQMERDFEETMRSLRGQR